MKTNYIPAIVMLCAGVIDSIFAILHHMEMYDYLKQLLLVLIVFLLIGNVLKLILDIGLKNMEDKEEEETEQETEQETEEKHLENIDATETDK